MSIRLASVVMSAGTDNVQAPKMFAQNRLAQNFQNNYAERELKPVVKDDIVANKLDIFA